VEVMGYRSYGGFVFPSSQLQMYEEICPKMPLNDWEDVTHIDLKYKKVWYEDKYFRDNPELVHLFFSGWKWYESYPSIQQIKLFQDYLTENGHPWFFYRKGEGDGEDPDIEQDGPDTITFGGLDLGNRLDMLDLESGLEVEEYLDTLFDHGEYGMDESIYWLEMVFEKETTDKVWETKTKNLKKHLEKIVKDDSRTFTVDDIKWELDAKNLRARIELQPRQKESVDIQKEVIVTVNNLFGSGNGSIFKITKDSGGFFEITTVFGDASPWDYDIQSQVGIGWGWNPELAKPPQTINKRRVI
jgi:hypothetical protein